MFQLFHVFPLGPNIALALITHRHSTARPPQRFAAWKLNAHDALSHGASRGAGVVSAPPDFCLGGIGFMEVLWHIFMIKVLWQLDGRSQVLMVLV